MTKTLGQWPRAEHRGGPTVDVPLLPSGRATRNTGPGEAGPFLPHDRRECERVVASSRERLHCRIMDGSEYKRDLEGVAGTQDSPECRRLPGEQIAVGPNVGPAAPAWASANRTVGSRNTNSVAMATHRSAGLTGLASTGSCRIGPCRSGRSISVGVRGEPPHPARNPASSSEPEAALPTVKKEDSSRLVPINRGTSDAEPDGHLVFGGRRAADHRRRPASTSIRNRRR